MRSRLQARRLHVFSQAWCELAFKLLNGVGSLERLGRLVVVANKVLDSLLKLVQAGKMLWLQELTLRAS